MGTYDGDDFAELSEESRIREVAREELFKTAVRFQTRWQDLLIEAEWNNTGEGINSITLTPQREGADSYTVGSDKIQILIAEFGRRPGAAPPPPDAIAPWVNEQSGLPSRGEEDFESVVYLVGQSIAENGIEAIAAGRRAFDGMGDAYEERVAERLGDE